MEAFEIKATNDDKLIITIDRSAMDAKFLADLIKQLKKENQAVKKTSTKRFSTKRK